MKIFDRPNIISLSDTCMKKYNSFAFDGCFYYFTLLCSKEILKTDGKFHILYSFDTCREYDSLCYDAAENCFWASTKKQSLVIYKLNCNFCEIDNIPIDTVCCPTGEITGLSYCCKNNRVFAAYSDMVLSVEKETGSARIVYSSPYMSLTGMLSLYPATAVVGLQENTQYIYFIDEKGAVIYSCSIPCKLLINDIAFAPCGEDEGSFYIDFFILKRGCYPYIYRCEAKYDDMPFIIDECNILSLSKCGCEDNSDDCAALLDALSVIECSLAHILNTEGELLQKMLRCCDDTDILLRTNKSVNKLITDISQLEYMLYIILSSLTDGRLCGNPCDDDG